MDLAKVIRQLYEELQCLDAAILSLQKLQDSSRRRSQAPEWLAEVDRQAAERQKRKSRRKDPKKESG